MLANREREALKRAHPRTPTAAAAAAAKSVSAGRNEVKEACLALGGADRR